MLPVATTILGLGWTGFGIRNLKNTFNDVFNEILFTRYTSINLSKNRTKNIYESPDLKTMYIYSINEEYKHTVVYLHGSGGSIHDREFICQMLDEFKVNYIVMEYPIGMSNILSKTNISKINVALDEILLYHNLKHDILWGTSLGGNIATWIFNHNPNYNKLIHCISFFDLSTSDKPLVSSVAKIHSLTLPSSITKEKFNPKDTRPKLIISSKTDEYFHSQLNIHNIKETDSIKILYVSGSHANIQLQDISKELCEWGDFVNPSEGMWLYIDSIRKIVYDHLSDLYE